MKNKTVNKNCPQIFCSAEFHMVGNEMPVPELRAVFEYKLDPDKRPGNKLPYTKNSKDFFMIGLDFQKDNTTNLNFEFTDNISDERQKELIDEFLRLVDAHSKQICERCVYESSYKLTNVCTDYFEEINMDGIEDLQKNENSETTDSKEGK